MKFFIFFGYFISIVLHCYGLLVVARCVLSFIPGDSPAKEFVYKVTEPALIPCRKIMYMFNYNLPIDLSPMILILVLNTAGFFIQKFISLIIRLNYFV